MTPGFNLTPLSSFGSRLPLKMRYLFAKRLVPKVPPDSSMRSSPCLIRALIDRFTVLSLAASHSDRIRGIERGAASQKPRGVAGYES